MIGPTQSSTLLVAASRVAPAGSKPPLRAPPIAWEPSELTARERAGKRRLPLVIYVRADWSAASIAMDRETFAHPSVLRQARRFVALKIDVTTAEGDAELRASRYRIQGVPTVIILDARGHEAARLTGDIGPGALLEAIGKAGEQ